MPGIGTILCSNVEYPDVRFSLMDSIPGITLLSLMRTSMDIALVFNPLDAPEIRKMSVLREQLVCIGREDIIGGTDQAIEFEDLLGLPLIFCRRLGTLLDNTGLLRQSDARARLRLNSVQGITDALLDSLGCMIGTRMYFCGELQADTLHHRLIAGPPIVRTLFLCQAAERPSTALTETMSGLLLKLVGDALREGGWDATLI